MRCPRCRKVSGSGAKFCAACGARLAPASNPPPGDVAPLTGIEPVLAAIARTAARLCDASDALIFRVEGNHYRLVAKHGAIRVLTALGDTRPITRGIASGLAILERRTVHVRDLTSAAARRRFPGMGTLQQESGTRTILATPLLLDGAAVGVIVIRRTRVRPFSAKQIALLQTFADQAALALDNARLSRDLRASNRELTEALEQQAATSEILRVISASPTDLQLVLDVVVRSAARFCGADDTAIFRLDGGHLRAGAHHGPVSQPPDLLLPVVRGTVGGRTVLERRAIQVADLQAEAEEYPAAAANARDMGFRTILSVPLLREGTVIGVIQLRRAEPNPFTDNQISLLETFADQAVIAIENVRLFTELETRNRDLTRALEQQTATAGILRVIGGSPTQVQPVFDAIVDSAVRLLRGISSAVFRLDDGLVHLVAYTSTSEAGDAAFREVFPRPLAEAPFQSQTIRERVPCVISDVESDPRASEQARRAFKARGYRSAVYVPMFKDGAPVGNISVARQEPGTFTEDDIALLQTFADQAVIAIENVRLFKELEAKNRDLTEALEQQTATSEILRVISRSQTDVQPVFDAIVESAGRLCGAESAVVYRFDGDVADAASFYNLSPETIEAYHRLFPCPLRETDHLKRVVDGSVFNIADIVTDPHTSARIRDVYRSRGVRSTVFVPMVRDGKAIGAVGVSHRDFGAFSEKRVQLLKTFADQAVIAIENVRLFKELERRNRDVTEALEQQTATAEILRAISRSPTDFQPVFDTIVRSAARVCEAFDAVLVLAEGDEFVQRAHHGPLETVLHARYPLRDTVGGRAIVEARVIQVENLAEAPDYPVGRELAQGVGYRTTLSVPLLRDGAAIGAITIRRTEVLPFSDKQIALLQTFADQAVIAIENVRLFKELEAKNRDLSEALEQQTATGEVLKAISRSAFDLGPVFDTVVENAVRLCDAERAFLFRFDGELLRAAATYNVSPDLAEWVNRHPIALGRHTISARAGRERRTVQVDDVQADPEYAYAVRDESLIRTVLAVPMLKGDELVGVITIYRLEVRPFADKQVALIETFADQAVIAIENVRLFKELEARTAELTRSVRELRALGEVGQAVSSTLDLETVLATIVSRAVGLCGAAGGAIYEYDETGEEFHLRATEGLPEEYLEIARQAPGRKGEGATGRLAVTRAPVEIPDIAAPGAYQSRTREALIRTGHRALLAVPLLREDHILGSLVVFRKTAGEFGPEVIALLETFASQSALAIQNARLFKQIEAKSRELEVASRHKSAFLANMSHELRTPLNAIIGYSEMLEEDAADLDGGRLVPDLQKINAAGKHLLELINAVLDLSKIEAGKMDLHLEEFGVPALVWDVAAVIRPLAEKNGNRLEIRCPENAGQMRADLTKVRQTLFNLLSNACKFTDRGTITLAVGRETGDHGHRIAFTISDTGIGMTGEQMERLFQDFSQADTATTRRYGGTGLGLALSQRLCRMMGGDIAVESEPGRGSTFTVTLPAVVAGPALELSAPSGPVESAGAAGTVLVIDDEDAVRDLMRRFLGREGFRVATAMGGEEGLRLAREVSPDAITLDVMMPGMDGWAVLSQLKADPELADIPVIMLTIVDDKNLGYALGATDYLTKPIDRERLAAVLARYRRGLSVLVVDDDADFRQLVRRLLERDGYTVAEAENGRAALARVRESPPGLILLDLMMPELDGFAFVDEFRREPAWRGIPIVVVTAKDLTAEDRQRLNGSVEKILQKGAHTRDSLLKEVRDLVVASVSRRRGGR